MRKKFISLILILCLLTAVLCGCADKDSWQRGDITVTVLNGEHYRVSGENKQKVTSDTVTFEIELDEGYEVVGAFGDGCEISDNLSWQQTVTFKNVRYSSTVQLETKLKDTVPFGAFSEEDMGGIKISSALGASADGEWYFGDMLYIEAQPTEETRFLGWSTQNYLTAGGVLLTENREIVFDTKSEYDYSEIYANFRKKSDDANCIIYNLGTGEKVTQDCTTLIAHHYRANTLTEKNLKDGGYALKDGAMLAGWQTEDGSYVGLGSRVTVSDKEPIFLNAIWVDYSPENEFVFDAESGAITGYTGSAQSVVIPDKIGGKEVKVIAEGAFKNGSAEVFYIPSTVTSVKPNAFLNCTHLTELYMSDNIYEISDSSFTGCANFTTVHMNAYLNPNYCHDIHAGISDVFDQLILAEGRKIVLVGGSSVQHGYDYAIIEDMFANEIGQITAFNFGLTMGISGAIWFDLLEEFLSEGDIYLHAPELWSVPIYTEFNASALTGQVGRIWSYVYTFAFLESNWQLVGNIKINDYCNFFASFSEFNSYRRSWNGITYAHYFGGGDGRGGAIGPEIGWDANFGLNGDLRFDAAYPDVIRSAGTDMYARLAEKGVKVFYTFAPINRVNLYVSYGNEDNLYAQAMAHTEKVKTALKGSGATVLLSQYDTIYDGRHFFNTDYHLGTPTRQEHTRKIISAMIEELKNE